jgi:F0F1-type ATP synthase gamma subunit
VARELKKKKISYKLLKIGKFVNKMASIFEATIDDYEKLEISEAFELVDKVTEVIIRDLSSQELDVLVS